MAGLTPDKDLNEQQASVVWMNFSFTGLPPAHAVFAGDQ